MGKVVAFLLWYGSICIQLKTYLRVPQNERLSFRSSAAIQIWRASIETQSLAESPNLIVCTNSPVRNTRASFHFHYEHYCRTFSGPSPSTSSKSLTSLSLQVQIGCASSKQGCSTDSTGLHRHGGTFAAAGRSAWSCSDSLGRSGNTRREWYIRGTGRTAEAWRTSCCRCTWSSSGVARVQDTGKQG